jgi:hypothetical protein
MSGSMIFIEYPDEIDLYKKFIDMDTIVVSMGPSVGVELSKRNIKFISSASFFESKDHCIILTTSAKIVEKIRPLLNGFVCGKVNYSFEKNWIFYFRFYLHYWLAMLQIIHTAVKKNSPDMLITLESINASQLEMVTSDSERFLGMIVRMYGEAHGLKIQYVKNAYKVKIFFLIKKFLKRLAEAITFEFLLFLYPVVIRNKVTILAPDPAYNMQRLMGEVAQNIGGATPVYLRNNRINLIKTIQSMVKRDSFSFIRLASIGFSKRRQFKEKYSARMGGVKSCIYSMLDDTTINEVSLNSPLIEFIENGLTDGMECIYKEALSLNRVLNVVQPKYVFSQHSLGVNYILGEYCKKNTIPSLLISHGSYVPHPDTVAELEWSVHAHTMINSKYQFVALQTPWSLKFLEEQEGVVSQGIATGPLLFARKSANSHSEKRDSIYSKHGGRRIVLHASSPKSWKTFRPWIYETVDEYIRNINDVIKAVEKTPNLYLAIRFRPLKELNLSEFKSSLISSDCYNVYSEGSFEEYLIHSDLLISYSSTAIEEALQNHIPVLQYDPDGKYEHIPGSLLSGDGDSIISSVYMVNSEYDLSPALLWWSKKHVNKESIDWSNHIMDVDNMTWLDLMH